MGETTGIEWADSTFNPWVGCTKVSAACDHCYAEGWAKRAGTPELWTGERRRTGASNWQRPRLWNGAAKKAGVRRRVFCASLADVFDNQVPPEWRDDLWNLITQTPWLDWMLLTKRPQNIVKMLPTNWGGGYANVWLGTTVEDQTEAERRIPALIAAPARIHFLSCEPLLGLVDLTKVRIADGKGMNEWEGKKFNLNINALRGSDSLKWDGLDWIIAGGESGPGARPMHPDWARSLRDQCAGEGTPFLFKQWGDWHADALLFTNAITGACPSPELRIGKKKAGRLLDGRTWDEFPEGFGEGSERRVSSDC